MNLARRERRGPGNAGLRPSTATTAKQVCRPTSRAPSNSPISRRASSSTVGGRTGSARGPCFPATAGRMRLFPGLRSSEGRRRRHRTAGASLDFANGREVGRDRKRPTVPRSCVSGVASWPRSRGCRIRPAREPNRHDRFGPLAPHDPHECIGDQAITRAGDVGLALCHGPMHRSTRRGLLHPPDRAIVDRLGTASATRAAALGGDAIAGLSASRHAKQ